MGQMRFDPLLFLVGSCTVQAACEYRTALMDLCLCEGINYREFAYLADGGVSFRTSLLTCRRLQKRCRELGIALTVRHTRGLPALAFRYRRRAGLLVGALLGALLLFWSGRFVWHVQVTGNERLDEGTVLEQLRACGFGVGSYIPALDTAKLENRFLLAGDEIAWVSIYLDGTVARVQIIEFTETPPDEPITRPANLLASADGQIESLELLRGNCVVSVGQAVKKGELLVSGIYDSAVDGFRYTRAAGRVLARTEREFRVEIPLCEPQKIYGEPKKCEIVLNFFNFSLKIFKNTGNLPPSCDIIKETRSYKMQGGYPLPVSLTLSWAVPYEEESLSRSPEEALPLAYEALERELSALADDAQILRKEISTTITDSALSLCCTVSCIENIAEQVEFEIVPQNVP